MAGRRIAYEPWQSPDPGKRYCLVDTMDLLQVCRRDRRFASMVEAVRDGRTILPVPGVVDECAAVFGMHRPGAPPPECPYAGSGRCNACGRSAGPPSEFVERSDAAELSRMTRHTASRIGPCPPVSAKALP